MDNIKRVLIALMLLFSSGASAEWTYGVYGPSSLNISVGQPGATQLGNDFSDLIQKPLTSTVGGQTFSALLSRAITPANLAKVGRIAAKAAGPIGIGLIILDAIYDEPTQQWKVPDQANNTYPHGRWEVCWYEPAGWVGRSDSPRDAADELLDHLRGLGKSWAVNGIISFYKVEEHYEFQIANLIFSTSMTLACDQGKIYKPDQDACSYPNNHDASDDELDAAIKAAIENDELKLKQMASAIAGSSGMESMEDLAEPDTTISGPAELPKKIETTTSTENGVETTEQTETQTKAEYDKDQANLKEEKKKTKCTGGTCTTTQTRTGGNQGGGNNGGGIDNGGGGGGGGGTGGDNTVTSIDFCITNPDRVGCINVGDPATADIPLLTETRDISMTAELTANGQCPASIPINLHGVSTSLSFDGVCSLARGLRPIVILVAWLSSGIFVFQVARG